MSEHDRSSNETTGMTPWSGQSSGPATAERVLVGGRYEILGLVGSGGMGSVYRARDRELDEIVALKTLREGLTATPRLLERFRREVKLARRVTHANVARTYDIGEQGNEKFLTMEYIDGEPLSTLIAREGRLPPPRVASIVDAVCAGLEAAHAVGVVHRDLKPDNVLIEKSGRVVITDFGIACAHEDPSAAGKTLGGVVGTPAYMAPEQVEAQPDVDARADIYALGVMLFEMLTGRTPWPGESAYAVAAARLTSPPPNPRTYAPEIPDALAAIVMRCMARQREERPASVREVAIGLDANAPTVDLDAPVRSTRGWQPPEPAASAKSGEKTVAVLPLANAGPPEDDYLADGLTEDLIDTLSMTPGLKLRPRASVVAQAEKGGDPRDVGRALGVEVVIEGSVRRLGEAVRVAARVISVADGFQLWAKRFDRPRAEVLVVSDEAAHAIAEALTLDAASPVRQAPSDANAIDLYLKGRAELRRIWRDPTRRAVELFAQAHERAPNDPTLLAAYARARARLWYYDGGLEEGRFARELAERALGLAPERGESWLALASVRLVEQDLESAARLLKQALTRAPGLAEAHELLGEVRLEVGDLGEAIASFRTALALDPELRCRFQIARALGYEGRWDEVDALEKLPAEDAHALVYQAASRARLALWNPDPKRYLSEISLPGKVEDALPAQFAELCRHLIEQGSLDTAQRAFIDENFARSDQAPRFVVFKHQLACEAHAFAGDEDGAHAHLAHAVEAGLCDRNWLERCPLLRRLRERPELGELARQVNERAERTRHALD